MANAKDDLWQGDYKIPWHDPDFSRRMLAEHLAQDHDLASRRTEWIDRQVAWIHQQLLRGRSSRILDLGCGPGFYSHRLAALGHRCRGIDFGPASIDYAKAHTPPQAHCEFVLGDLRRVEVAGPYDLALFLYGELNVFSPAEALGILRKTKASLLPHGQLVIELQTPEAVERTGRNPATEEQPESGLFCERPYRCRTRSEWHADRLVAVQTFTVTQIADGTTQVYRSTTKAWPDDALTQLLAEAGFRAPERCRAWPCNTETLTLWMTETD